MASPRETPLWPREERSRKGEGKGETSRDSASAQKKSEVEGDWQYEKSAKNRAGEGRSDSGVVEFDCCFSWWRHSGDKISPTAASSLPAVHSEDEMAEEAGAEEQRGRSHAPSSMTSISFGSLPRPDDILNSISNSLSHRKSDSHSTEPETATPPKAAPTNDAGSASAEGGKHASNLVTQGTRGRRRSRSRSSPPPDPNFEHRVGFDTFSNKNAAQYSLTLRAQHKDYKWSKSSRTFLCGLDDTEYSESAMDWLLDTLVEDGDELVALRVIDEPGRSENEYYEEANRIMASLLEKNEDDKAISIIVEYASGKVRDLIQQMIHTYSPDSLIVGTKGKAIGLQSLRAGSISKYCLQHSPVPVVVVRPDRKREKIKNKRMADPSRRSYSNLMDKISAAAGD